MTITKPDPETDRLADQAEGHIGDAMAALVEAGAGHAQAALLLHFAVAGMISFNPCAGCAHKGLEVAHRHLDAVAATVPAPEQEHVH